MTDTWEENNNTDSDEPIDDSEEHPEVTEARSWLAAYNASGGPELHTERLADDRYKGSIEYTIASETRTLERLIEHYDKLLQRTFVSRDLLEEDLYAGRIGLLHASLLDAIEQAESLDQRAEDIDEAREEGRLSPMLAGDKKRRVSYQEQRAQTRLEMAGLGLTYDDLGQLSDEASHLIEDAFSPDGGAQRQAVSRMLRSMSREDALEYIQDAVDRGVIDEASARRIIMLYVRPT